MGRREALGVLGASLLASPILGAAAPASADRLDFEQPSDRLKAFMLMRGALDERLVIGCASARYYGVVEGELTPLFGVVSATFARYRRSPDGGYTSASAEHAYFTDPESGRAMRTFRNPYTAETVEVPSSGYPPVLISISPSLEVRPATPIPGMDFDHRVAGFEARGDDVWITELTRTSRSAPGASKPFRYSENVILHARRSELERPGEMRVPCEVGFTNVVGWRPWLKMGDRAGHMMSVGSGRYGITIAELPEAWLAAARVGRPELLADPMSVLAPLWGRAS